MKDRYPERAYPQGESDSGSEHDCMRMSGADVIAAASAPSYYVNPAACCSKDGQRLCRMHTTNWQVMDALARLLLPDSPVSDCL